MVSGKKKNPNLPPLQRHKSIHSLLQARLRACGKRAGGEEGERLGEASRCLTLGPGHGSLLLQKGLGVAAYGFMWGPTSRKGCWKQLTQSLQVGNTRQTCD